MIKNLVSSIPYSARLWLSWGKIHHTGSGKVELKELRLTGPVLQDCLALEVSGNILLDLTKHFLVLIPKPYIIKFEWNSITFQDLKEVKIEAGFLIDGDLGLLNNLKNDDKILIDCSGHHTNDEAKGRYRISFGAILCNKTEEPYNFFK